MRILITGSRNHSDIEGVNRAIVHHATGHPANEVTIVHGDCPTGADATAHAVAINNNYAVETHPADWRQLGKKAGPIRNQHMVDKGADVCLAFPTSGSVGTWDCINRANQAGIPVKIYNDPNF